MALGWPVMDNGPMPGRPMRPVYRWALMMALTLSLPLADWLTPCENSVTTFSVVANQSSKRASASACTPQSAATCAGSSASALAACTAASAPEVPARKSPLPAPTLARCTSRRFHKRTSLSGRMGRCRSARSQVAVRRGSMTTTRICGRAALAAARRW